MTTWAETMEILDWMTPRWVDVGRWSDERIAAFHDDLRPWPAKAVEDTIRYLYEEGGAKAPNGGQIIRAARARGFRPDADETQHRHVWAVIEYEDQRTDGRRLVECAVCHEEKLGVPAGEQGDVI